MKRILISILLIVSTLMHYGTAAQEVFIGKASPYGRTGSQFEIIGNMGGRTWIYRATNSEYYLDAYNDSMRLLATVALDFFPKETYSARFINYSDRMIVFFIAEERGKMVLYGALLDDKGMIQKNPRLLHEEKISWIGSKDNTYKAIFSEDRSKLAILVQSGGKDTREFTLLTFSNKLERLNSQKIKIPKEEVGTNIKLEYAQISNSGKLILPTFSTTNRGSIEESSVLIFDPSSSDYNNIALSGKKEYYGDMIFKLDNVNEKLHVAAFYKDGNAGNVEGTVIMQVDLRSHELVKQQKNEFPERFLKTYKEKNWKKAFNNAHLQQLIVKQDGSIILISEDQIFSIQNHYSGGYIGYYSYYSGPMSLGSTREYSFEDIVIMNYENDGTLSWSEFVRKKQYSQEDEGMFSSFAFMNTGGSLVMLYNNFASKDHSISVAAIDKRGQLQMTRINQFNRNVEWYMQGAKQIANRQIVIPTLSRNELNFVKVVF